MARVQRVRHLLEAGALLRVLGALHLLRVSHANLAPRLSHRVAPNPFLVRLLIGQLALERRDLAPVLPLELLPHPVDDVPHPRVESGLELERGDHPHDGASALLIGGVPHGQDDPALAPPMKACMSSCGTFASARAIRAPRRRGEGVFARICGSATSVASLGGADGTIVDACDGRCGVPDSASTLAGDADGWVASSSASASASAPPASLSTLVASCLAAAASCSGVRRAAVSSRGSKYLPHAGLVDTIRRIDCLISSLSASCVSSPDSP